MNNSAVAQVLEQTGLLLEYRDGGSFFVDELFRASEQIKLLEVPLEVFENASTNKQDARELEQVLNYWFCGFSPDLLWNLHEVVATGTCPLREQLLHDVSPSVVGLLRLNSLSASSVACIREDLHIRNVELLKKACKDNYLVKSGRFTEQEELDILEDILRLEETNADSSTSEESLASDSEICDSIEEDEPEIQDSKTMFWANADALADFIVSELSSPRKLTTKQLVTDLISSDAMGSVKDQVRGVFGRVKRFFTSREKLSFESRQNPTELNEQNSGAVDAASDASDEALRIDKVGAVRRGQDVLSRLEFLICTNNPSGAFERIKKESFVDSVLFEKNRVLAVVLKSNCFVMPFNNRPTPPATLYFYAASEFVYGTMDVLLTSKKEHWDALKRKAASRGYRLTAFGLYEGARRISSRTTERLYDLLSLPVVPEELREKNYAWDWIDSGTPELLAVKDLQGDLHMHTTFTDGSGDIEEMATVARGLGLSYIALTDHTQRVTVAGGMNDVEFLRYWETIDEYNEKLRSAHVPFQILKGAEVDILEDGGLDLTDETLAQADWIVASIHFGKRQPRERIHRRYMDAFLSPYVDVIAHPTGRMIGIEEPIDVDFEFLCENARKYGKCLELNSQPRRLDLSVEPLRLAKKHGVPIVISTDSHASEQLSYLRFGALQAFRAGLEPCDVLNTLSLDELLKRRSEMREGVARK